MNNLYIGSTWREKGKRGRAVVITAGNNFQVRAQFVDSKREVTLYTRTLLKHFTPDARS